MKLSGTEIAIMTAGLSGAVSALMVDLHAYINTQGEKSFNWKLTIARIVYCGLGNAAAAAGVSAGVSAVMG